MWPEIVHGLLALNVVMVVMNSVMLYRNCRMRRTWQNAIDALRGK